MPEVREEYDIGLYTEFRRDGKTTQYFLMPESIDGASGKKFSLALANRLISAKEPRRSWRIKRSEFSASAPLVSGLIKPQPITSEALKYAAEALRSNGIGNYYAAMAEGGWMLYRVPLAVEVNTIEKTGFGESPARMVESLSARIGRARIEAGFEASLWDTDGTVGI